MVIEKYLEVYWEKLYNLSLRAGGEAISLICAQDKLRNLYGKAILCLYNDK